MYEYFDALLKRYSLRIIDVSRNTGIPYSTFTDWKAGRYTPKIDKLEKIAYYFNIPVEYFKTGQLEERKSIEGKKYYFDDDTAQKAQELFDNPDLRALLDAARDSKPENIQMAAEMLRRFKETNPDG